MKKNGIIFLSALLLLAVQISRAEELKPILDDPGNDEDVISVYGKACEKIRAGEAKSAARLRGTDKATFSAVASVSALSDFRDKSDGHDFNVLVYNIVDNYVEDLAVRTLKQTDEEICLEVTGYVRNSNIIEAVTDSLSKEEEEPSSPPPLSPKQAAEKALNDEIVRVLAENTKVPDTSDLIAAEEKKAKEAAKKEQPAQPDLIIVPLAEKKEPDAAAEDQRSLIYFAPTKFYNQTVSESYAALLKEQFRQMEDFYFTDRRDLADYIVSSEVLRAKVDPINSNTNRLQMVISVTVEVAETGSSTTEHQNRFVLFSSDENEQEVALKLMKKLFNKAGEQIMQRIEQLDRRRNNGRGLPKIITPAAPQGN